MSEFPTYEEMAQGRATVEWPGLRERGSRLDPGELEEIAVTAGRGEAPTGQQVLGLIETVQALARRCAVRFQEAQELRAQLAELATPETVFGDCSIQAAEVERLRDELTAVVERRDNALRSLDEMRGERDGAVLAGQARIAELQRMVEWHSGQAAALAKLRDRIALIAEHPQVTEVLALIDTGAVAVVDDMLPLVNSARQIRRELEQFRGE